jgi:hypothetical protein
MRLMMRAPLLAGALLFGCGPKVIDGGEPTPDSVVAVCEPGTSEVCYNGPAGTQGIGPCVAGSRVCGSDGQWGQCAGEVLPSGEACANGVDDNCNGATDEEADQDGDGFTNCGGDCCDSTNEGCASPALVNPAAFEAAGNMLDDDCDGAVDNILAANCDGALASNSGNAADYAAAIDICQTTTAGDSNWGLLSARLTRADGTGAPNVNQHAIRTAFGATAVQSGAAFTVLSTGHAAAPGQTNPSFLDFQRGSTTLAGLGGSSGFPDDFMNFHGGQLPNAPGCPVPDAGQTANDPVMLELEVRAPSNAKSFSFSMNFLSSEYPEWTCSLFNDFFVVLLDSAYTGTPANPADKNLAFYTSAANQVFPVGVNLASGNTGLFTQCKNGVTGCTENQNPNLTVEGSINTCANITELAGTGMDILNPDENPVSDGFDGFCGANNTLGGGTGWLTTSGNIVGGEVFKLRIAIWDTSDGIYDSVALIDNFQWSVEASQPGTVLQKPKY